MQFKHKLTCASSNKYGEEILLCQFNLLIWHSRFASTHLIGYNWSDIQHWKALLDERIKLQSFFGKALFEEVVFNFSFFSQLANRE